MPGRTPCAAIAVPDSSPPPPTGATTTSRSGTSSSSSSVAVPCPAITATSSYGCTSVAPVARATSAHVASRAASVGAQKCTCAPKPSTFATLIFGRVVRHHDVRRDAAPSRRVRERRAVVAGGVRDHAARGDVVGQREHGVAGAARLERAHLLQVLALDEEARAGRVVERPAREHRRPVHVRRDPRVRRADRGEVRQRQRVPRIGIRHQLPGRLWTLGKKRSFHESGFTLIAPTLDMKSAYFMMLCGVCV